MPGHRAMGAGAALVLLPWTLFGPPPGGRAGADESPGTPEPAVARLVVIQRCEAMDRADGVVWQVDYRLRNAGPSALVLGPGEIEARVGAWVSNSRVPGHDVPRRSELSAGGSSGWAGSAEVIPSADEARRCRERLGVQVWLAAEGDEPRAAEEPAKAKKDGAAAPAPRRPPIRLAPGEVVRVRLRLEHEHALYGAYNALLGTREIELRLGPATIADRVPLDRERKLAAARPAWAPSPPAEFLDRRIFLSAPDSLHLEANVPGHQSWRFPDFRPVRCGGRMRLSFWYLVAPGTDGECRARVVQYRDLPRSWKILHDGEVDERLTTVGRWVRVERVFRVEAEASSLGLEFGILGADLAAAELWIDDVRLEPVEEVVAGP